MKFTKQYCYMLIFPAFMLFIGCAKQQISEPNPFFDEWKAQAETAQPYLPQREIYTEEQNPDGNLDTNEKDPQQATDEQTLIEKTLVDSLPTQKITVRFIGDDIPTVLRTLARLAEENILISPNVQGTINTHIEATPWNVVFMSIINSYGLTVTKNDNLLYVMSLKDLEQELARKSLLVKEEELAPLVTKLVAIEYSEPANIANSVTVLLAKTKDGKTRGSVSVDTHSRSIIIRETQENMNKLLKLVYDLDRPTPQILIKAHIVEATKDTARELGVEWGSHTDLSRVSNGDPHYTSSGNFGVDGGASLGVLTTMSILANSPDITLDVQLSALQTDGKVNILSSPSIATLDNNQAIIESGTTIPYPNGTDDQGNIVYAKAKATLKLTVTPHVIADNRIKLNILAQKDEVDSTRSVNGVPYILTKNAQTNLIVQNDSTVVIAGLTKEKEANTDTGVPWLKEIPILGHFFNTKSNASEFEDLLIFITPTILIQ